MNRAQAINHIIRTAHSYEGDKDIVRDAVREYEEAVLNPLLKAIDQISAAIEDEGPNPHYHRQVFRRHVEEWPAFWERIDKLIEARENARL